MVDFFQTVMGRTFYEVHVPKISNSLERIAKSLEKIIDLQEKSEIGGSKPRPKDLKPIL